MGAAAGIGAGALAADLAADPRSAEQLLLGNGQRECPAGKPIRGLRELPALVCAAFAPLVGQLLAHENTWQALLDPILALACHAAPGYLRGAQPNIAARNA